MRCVASGVDPHRVHCTATQFHQLALAHRSDAALAARLLNQLPAGQRINMAGRFGMNEMKDLGAEFFGHLIHFTRFFIGLFGSQPAKDRVLNRDSRLHRLLAQFVNPVAATGYTTNFARIRRRQSVNRTVLTHFRHRCAESFFIGCNAVIILDNNLLCSFLHYGFLPLLMLSS